MQGAFNFTAKYKYNAWKKIEGMSQDDAKAKYVALLKGVSYSLYGLNCKLMNRCSRRAATLLVSRSSRVSLVDYRRGVLANDSCCQLDPVILRMYRRGMGQ